MTETLAQLTEVLSPERMQRLANRAVNHLGLGLVDITVESHDDGRTSITLPSPWAFLLISHLEATAGQLREQLRIAMNRARMKDARLQAELATAAKNWEEEQSKIHKRYREFVAGGLTKRDAIRKIKGETGMTATLIQSIVEGQDPANPKRRKRDVI